MSVTVSEISPRTRARRAGIAAAVASFLLLTVMHAAPALAEETVCYLGEAVDAGFDTGYAQSNTIAENSPHFGWDLGSFYVTGFTSKQKAEDGTFTFLKTVDDQLVLHFRLDQDINCLNGNTNLTVSSDANGYDEEMGVSKLESGFGRGALIIRRTDYQNATSDPEVYVDYLSGVEQGADTVVQLFEEGDYEVVLDYELMNDVRNVFGVMSVLPEYSNYTVRFTFSVRNGNTMVFLFDAETGDELTNSSTTTNGFTIDLARSHYLDINVRREVLSSNGSELVADTRQNGPAKDGEVYTEPGIYTITATNQTTGETTEKVINVGNDPVLQKYAADGGDIAEIQAEVAAEEAAAAEAEAAAQAEQQNADKGGLGAAGIAALVGVGVVIVALAAVVALVLRRSKQHGVAGESAVAGEVPPAEETDASAEPTESAEEDEAR